MSTLLAQAEPVFLTSIVKPLLFGAAVTGWGFLASRVNEDATYFYLKRDLWNMASLVSAAVGFGLMLVIPIFWIGFFVGVLPPAGMLVGYFYYRNTQVPYESQRRFSWSMLTGRIETYKQDRAQRAAKVRLMTMDEEVLEVPHGDAPYSEAHRRLEDLLEFALPRGADRIEMMASKEKLAISVRIDGVRYSREEGLEPSQALEIIDYLKEAAGLDVEDRRKRQQGELLMESDDHGRHTLDLQTAGSTRGQQLMVTIDPSELANIPFTKLGMLDAQARQFRDVLQSEAGVVLTTGPAKQGITTLTYSLLQEHDPYTSSVLTLEDQVAFEAEGVKHNTLPAGYTNKQFYDKLAAMLRGDPNVVMLSHVPDQQTADLVAKNSEEVRFYVPMEDADTFTAMRKWIKLVGKQQRAAEGLVAVVAGRLVRRLCDTCKQPYTPDRSALKRLNLPSNVSQLYQASGEVVYKDKPQTCPTCLGMGYRGRTGVYEVMVLDAQARAFLASNEFDRLRSHLRKQKALWLQEAALTKVVNGETDIKEVTRVMGDSSGGKSQSASRSRQEGDGGSQKTVKEQSSQ
jgi:general secretion pathway protein E